MNQLTILQTMLRYNIDNEEECKKRLSLFQESGLANSDLRDKNNLDLIDRFMSQDSETLAHTVLFEKVFTRCLNEKEFVRNYDRLTNSKLASLLYEMNSGIEPNPNKVKKEFEKFESFVKSTVFNKIEKEATNG